MEANQAKPNQVKPNQVKIVANMPEKAAQVARATLARCEAEPMAETMEILRRRLETVNTTPIVNAKGVMISEDAEAAAVRMMWTEARANEEPAWLYGYLLQAAQGVMDSTKDASFAEDVTSRAIVRIWGITKGVYHFHPMMLASLLEKPAEGSIPTEVLDRLPEWCVYLRFPGGKLPLGHLLDGEASGSMSRVGYVRGCYVILDKYSDKFTEWVRKATAGDAESEESLYWSKRMFTRRFMHVLLDIRGMASADLRKSTLLLTLPLLDTVEESVKALRMTQEECGLARPNPDNDFLPSLMGRLLNLLFYLCAKNAEVGPEGAKRPENPENPHIERSTVKGKRSLSRVPKVPIREWPVGWRIGARLREQLMGATSAADPSIGSPKRPHVRRAHFHTYRVGEGRTRAEIKWLPPIFVGVSQEEATEGKGGLPIVDTQVPG